MEPIFQEIASLRKRPEEVLSMWSEALPMLDENSLKYRVEELSEEVDELNEKLEQAQKNAEKEKTAKEVALTEKEAALARIKELEQLLANKK